MSGGVLIEFGGLPGTGKSTLAERLAISIGAVWLRIDEIESAMRRHGLTAAQTGIPAYSVAHDVAANQLRRGLTVIADAVNPVEEARAAWRTLAEVTGARHRVIETRCRDLAEHRRRVEQRISDLPGWTYPGWDQVSERMASYQPRTDDRLILDTSNPVEFCQQQITGYLG